MKIIIEINTVAEGLTPEAIVDGINMDGINTAFDIEGLEESSITIDAESELNKAAPELLETCKRLLNIVGSKNISYQHLIDSTKALIKRVEGK